MADDVTDINKYREEDSSPRTQWMRDDRTKRIASPQVRWVVIELLAVLNADAATRKPKLAYDRNKSITHKFDAVRVVAHDAYRSGVFLTSVKRNLEAIGVNVVSITMEKNKTPGRTKMTVVVN